MRLVGLTTAPPTFGFFSFFVSLDVTPVPVGGDFTAVVLNHKSPRAFAPAVIRASFGRRPTVQARAPLPSARHSCVAAFFFCLFSFQACPPEATQSERVSGVRAVLTPPPLCPLVGGNTCSFATCDLRRVCLRHPPHYGLRRTTARTLLPVRLIAHFRRSAFTSSLLPERTSRSLRPHAVTRFRAFGRGGHRISESVRCR